MNAPPAQTPTGESFFRRLAVNPAFAALWIARTASLVGDYAFRVAFITSLVVSGESANVLALATAVLIFPSIVFYIFGGALGDRVRSRRTVLVWADIVRAVGTAVAAVSVMATSNPLPVIGCALLIGIGSGFFEPVMAGFLVQIVPRHRLVKANSALSVSRQIGLIIGPVLGGALVGLSGGAIVFWFDAATFAVSALALGAIPAAAVVYASGETADASAGTTDTSAEATASDKAADPAPLRRLGQDISAGIRYVASVRWLTITLLTGSLANAMFAGGLDVLVPLVFLSHDGKDPVQLGLFYALEGGGALLGAVILSRLTVRRVDGPMFGMLALMAASLGLVGVFGNGLIALALALSYGVGMHFFNTLYPALVQSTVPPKLISRVSSIEFLAFDGLMPLGILLMGPLSVWCGSRTALALIGVATTAMILSVCLAPSVRELRLPSETDRPATAADNPLVVLPAEEAR
ncbi:MFS transporter [Streptomyces sp. NPDC056704]|uniref:MFS transporter n=1 Tax=Streptomyces sp. NPDC056704 TaxID=3345917 RepID=UPI0036BAFC98